MLIGAETPRRFTHSPEEIRKFNHDIEAMLTQCEAGGLKITRQSRRFAQEAADYLHGLQK